MKREYKKASLPLQKMREKERENKTLDFQVTNLKRGKGSQGRHSLWLISVFFSQLSNNILLIIKEKRAGKRKETLISHQSCFPEELGSVTRINLRAQVPG